MDLPGRSERAGRHCHRSAGPPDGGSPCRQRRQPGRCRGAGRTKANGTGHRSGSRGGCRATGNQGGASLTRSCSRGTADTGSCQATGGSDGGTALRCGSGGLNTAGSCHVGRHSAGNTPGSRHKGRSGTGGGCRRCRCRRLGDQTGRRRAAGNGGDGPTDAGREATSRYRCPSTADGRCDASDPDCRRRRCRCSDRRSGGWRDPASNSGGRRRRLGDRRHRIGVTAAGCRQRRIGDGAKAQHGWISSATGKTAQRRIQTYPPTRWSWMPQAGRTTACCRRSPHQTRQSR